jgi:hypothetical protein
MENICLITNKSIINYRITGPQSIDRIEPLLTSLNNLQFINADDNIVPLQFVWETSCKISEKNQHLNSIILNRLHNSQIIEDKSNLAFLQLRMIETPMLETYIAKDSNGVLKWIQDRWNKDAKLSSSGSYYDNSNHCSNGTTNHEALSTISNDNNIHDNNKTNNKDVSGSFSNIKNNNGNTDKSCSTNKADWWVVKSSKVYICINIYIYICINIYIYMYIYIHIHIYI